ncbi:hypothetical protein WDZ92_42810 [Nostoc sp. NIES-2111]
MGSRPRDRQAKGTPTGRKRGEARRDCQRYRRGRWRTCPACTGPDTCSTFPRWPASVWMRPLIDGRTQDMAAPAVSRLTGSVTVSPKRETDLFAKQADPKDERTTA